MFRVTKPTFHLPNLYYPKLNQHKSTTNSPPPTSSESQSGSYLLDWQRKTAHRHLCFHARQSKPPNHPHASKKPGAQQYLYCMPEPGPKISSHREIPQTAEGGIINQSDKRCRRRALVYAAGPPAFTRPANHLAGPSGLFPPSVSIPSLADARAWLRLRAKSAWMCYVYVCFSECFCKGVLVERIGLRSN